ncbi:hypothetical protein ACFLSQ_03570 [Bacteroidota bacterium]
MKQFMSFLASMFLIVSLCSVNTYSEEKSDSVKMVYRKDILRTIYVSADAITNLQGLNTTLGLTYDVNIHNYGTRKVSAFYELNFSFPVAGDSTFSFSCMNAGLKFSSRISDFWSWGIYFGSGLAFFDKQYNVNASVRIAVTYRNISLISTMRSLISNNKNASIVGLGLAYNF